MRIIKRIHKEVDEKIDIPIKYNEERKAGWENPNPMSLEEFMGVDSEWSKMYREWKARQPREIVSKIENNTESVGEVETNSLNDLLSRMTTEHGRQEILRLKKITEMMEEEKDIEIKLIDDRKIDVRKKKKRRR